eukprot:Filipodium_phascolosomae@DN2301_c0_g1_i11.p1
MNTSSAQEVGDTLSSNQQQDVNCQQKASTAGSLENVSLLQTIKELVEASEEKMEVKFTKMLSSWSVPIELRLQRLESAVTHVISHMQSQAATGTPEIVPTPISNHSSTAQQSAWCYEDVRTMNRTHEDRSDHLAGAGCSDTGSNTHELIRKLT